MPLGGMSAGHNKGNKEIFTHSEEQRILADPLDGSHQVAFQRNLYVLSASQQHAILMRNKEPKRTRIDAKTQQKEPKNNDLVPGMQKKQKTIKENKEEPTQSHRLVRPNRIVLNINRTSSV